MQYVLKNGRKLDRVYFESCIVGWETIGKGDWDEVEMLDTESTGGQDFG